MNNSVKRKNEKNEKKKKIKNLKRKIKEKMLTFNFYSIFLSKPEEISTTSRKK